MVINMKEQIYTADQIIAKYGDFIEDKLRDYLMEEHNLAVAVISYICKAIQVEYDWKNSPEGFEDWLLRMAEERKINENLVDALSKLWNNAQNANQEYQAVYFGIKHVQAQSRKTNGSN